MESAHHDSLILNSPCLQDERWLLFTQSGHSATDFQPKSNGSALMAAGISTMNVIRSDHFHEDIMNVKFRVGLDVTRTVLWANQQTE